MDCERRRHRRPRRRCSRAWITCVELGVDALWLSPIYPSPMKDFGYDVADYCGIDPVFGTLADFDRLVEAAHARGLKLILDFVPNHTSDQHPWFLESRASRDNPKRDWYLWRDPSRTAAEQLAFQLRRQRVDRSTRRPASTTTTPSFPSSPTSTGATPRWWRRCSACCASGSSAAWTASASTCSGTSSRTKASPTTRRIPTGARAWTRTRRSSRSTAPTGPRCTTSCAGCAGSSTTTASRVLIGEIYLPLERLVQLLRRRPAGRAPAVQLPAPLRALGGARARKPHRRVRAHAARGRVAELGARQPRPPAHRLARRRRRRRASRRCCSSRCAARRRSTTATSSACATSRSRPQRCRTPSSAASPAWASAATRCARPCSGAPRRTPVFRLENRGSRFLATTGIVNVETQRDDPKSMLALHKALIALRRAEPALQVGRLELVETADEVLAYMREDRFLVLLNLGSTAAARARFPVPAPSSFRPTSTAPKSASPVRSSSVPTKG